MTATTNERVSAAYLAVIDEAEARLAVAEARIAALEAALTDLLTGAEQQSQSHVDVAARCRDALGRRR